jgi:hypothetical protein
MSFVDFDVRNLARACSRFARASLFAINCHQQEACLPYYTLYIQLVYIMYGSSKAIYKSYNFMLKRVGRVHD